ncbi:MAG: VIT domain-containing protein [Kofleriaceae bacterium]
MRSGYLCVLVMLAATSPARAGELPRVIGLHPPAGPGLAMLDSRIEVTVRGPIVEAVVTQHFQNRGDRATEATYVFPLPLDAAVSAMAIKNGSRTIKASIEKRDDAQRRYEAAVRAGVGAALLDQERPDVFTQTVSAIPARGTVEIVLRFDTVARYQNGTWELALPLVVAPRYVPGAATGQPTIGTGRAPDTNRAPDASRITPPGAPGAGGSTDIAITFVDKATDLASPTHELRVVAGGATLRDPKTDHDAIVRWKTPATTAGWVEQAPGTAGRLPAGDGGDAAVVVESPIAPPRKGTMRCLLVLDRSAASRGDADAVARPLVRALVGALGSSDRLAVAGSDQIAWATPSDVQRALDQAWLTPAGAFDLTRVLAAARPDGAPIVLVSGGLVADDRAAAAAAAKLGVPIHVIGVGPAPARGVLAALAVASGGTLRFAIPGDDLVALAKAALADAANQPAPLAVTWGTLAATEVVPGTLPRIGAGQATLVLARVKRAQTANGRAHGELFAIDALPSPRSVDGATTTMGPLARRWARNRLDELVAGRASAATITAHALRYGLVSPYTSMVAVGDEVVEQGGVKRSIAVPVSVPAGMKWQQVKKETTVEEPRGNTVTKLPDATTLSEKEKKPAADKTEPAKRQTPKVEPKPQDPTKNIPIQRTYEQNVPKPAPQPVTGTATQSDRGGRSRDDDDGEKPAKKKKQAELSSGEDEEPDSEDASPMAKRTATIDNVGGAEVMVLSSEGRSRRWRLATGIGGGLVRTRGETTSLLSLDARLEFRIARRTLFGVEGGLWLVDGDVAGNVLAAVARVGIARWIEAGFGLGVQAGGGVGPAGAVSLRFHLPPVPRAATFLRYDAALLSKAGEQRGQSTFTLGVEWGF